MCRLVTAVLLFLVVVVAASSSSPKLKVNGLVLLPFQRSNETSFRMLEDAESIVGGGGSTWVSLVVSFKQENINSTTIVLDDDLQLVQDTIQLAKNNGMSVIVKVDKSCLIFFSPFFLFRFFFLSSFLSLMWILQTILCIGEEKSENFSTLLIGLRGFCRIKPC